MIPAFKNAIGLRLQTITSKPRSDEPFSLEEVIMTLTKAKIVNSISNRLHLSKNRSSRALDSLLEIMKRELESGNDLLISGFGKFCVKQTSRREWRNPASDESVLLGTRRIVTFKCSSVLREKLNEAKALKTDAHNAKKPV